MWSLLEHRRVERQLNVAPREVLVRYEKWKEVVALSGPTGLRRIKGFHDESLTGKWLGHRSSRLGIQWRVVYRVEASEIRILVVSVTAHDYRRV